MKQEKHSRKRLWLMLGIVVLLTAITAVGAFAAYQNGNDAGKSIMAQADDAGAVSAEKTIYEQGVLVTGTMTDKPAAMAGVRRGSIILAVDGVEVNTARALIDAVSTKEAGSDVTLTVINSDTPEEITVTLADEAPYLGVLLEGARDFGRNADDNCDCETYENAVPRNPHGFGSKDGMLPDGIAPFERGEFDIEAFATGARIAVVDADSPAATAGLEAGDIITALDGGEVATVDELVAIIADKAPGDRVMLTIMRNDEEKSAMLVLGEHPDDATRGFMGIQVGPAMQVERRFGGQLPEGFGSFFGENGEFNPEDLEGMFPEGFSFGDLSQFFGEGGGFNPEDFEGLIPEGLIGPDGELNFDALEKMFPDGFHGFGEFAPEFAPTLTQTMPKWFINSTDSLSALPIQNR